MSKRYPFGVYVVGGDIIVDGLEGRWFGGLEGPHSALRFSRTEALEVVKLAAQLWPDQVVTVVHDAGVGAEAADLVLRAKAAIDAAVTPCGTSSCLSHATHECFWPGQTVKRCERCAARAHGVAAAMGFELVVRELFTVPANVFTGQVVEQTICGARLKDDRGELVCGLPPGHTPANSHFDPCCHNGWTEKARG